MLALPPSGRSCGLLTLRLSLPKRPQCAHVWQRWIRRRTSAVLFLFALVCLVPASLSTADEPNFTEQQKIDFMQSAKVINSKQAKKGTSGAWDLTLSDG